MLFQQIYDIVRQIPEGKVLTYGAVARAIHLRDVRKVGFALHSNAQPEEIPCHRVVKSDGRLAPGYAFGGETVQEQLLRQEGVQFTDEGFVDLEKSLWNLKS